MDGTDSATDIGYGAGIGRFDLGVLLGTLAGGVVLDPVVAAGALGGGNASGISGNVPLGGVDVAGTLSGGAAPGQLAGDVALAPVTAAGQLGGEVVSELGGAASLDGVSAGGLIVGVQPVSAAPSYRRLQTSTRAPRGGRRGSR